MYDGRNFLTQKRIINQKLLISMNIYSILFKNISKALHHLYGVQIDDFEFQATRKEFSGDITLVVFPLLRHVKGNPTVIGESIGEFLVDKIDEVKGFNVVKGFLNIELSDSYFLSFLNSALNDTQYGFVNASGKAVMVEYSSPNTNKPLHLGHIRNNLLGYSVAEILKASGKKVYKTQIINDRGIHICKSMLAWKLYGNGETPESSGIKGDKLVGNYYVKFDQEYKKQVKQLVEEGSSEEEAKKDAPLMIEAQKMLLDWESGDKEVVKLWEVMNSWVYAGFDVTYKSLGVDFDALYYESNTYLLGKAFIDHGLSSGVFHKKQDGSVWCDLTDEGLDEKIVLRSDGSSVYMTQDIGTAIQRIKDYSDVGGMVYTVGNEQDYHFKVLFLILQKLGFDWANNLFHLSYGMVDLPSGKMKSREGTVVDADDLIQEMSQTAASISQELGKLDGYSEEEKVKTYNTIGLGALKYFILKVDPKKRILFDPKESVDFQGNTGPFIQYTYARIRAIIRKSDVSVTNFKIQNDISLHEKEKEILNLLSQFPETIQSAAKNFSPALIANYTYDLVKSFNSFYQNVSILGADSEHEKKFRVLLSFKVGEVIKSSFQLLGIKVPERM